MRIICDWKDVYDCQHSMYDESHTWTRRTGEVLVRRNEDQVKLVGGTYNSAYFNYFPLFLGNRVHYVFAFYDKSRKFVDSTVRKERAVGIATELGINSLRFFGNSLEKDFDKLTTELLEKSQLAYNLFMELKAPIAYISSLSEKIPDDNSKQKVECYTVVTNPRLHGSILPWAEIDGNVYRIHQHVEQLVFGTFGTGEPDILTTSDRDRLEAKGFDYVTSFRKMPREN